MMKKPRKYWIFVMTAAVFIVLFHLAGSIEAVADFYRRHIFWLWPATYGWLTGLFPFSVGGVMIVAAFLLIAVLAVSLLLLPIFRKNKKYIIYIKNYAKAMLAITLCVLMAYTLNCTILYHCSKLSKGEKNYTVKELETLRAYLIEQCQACGTFQKDAAGASVYTGDGLGQGTADTLKHAREDLLKEVKKAMDGISDEIPELSGYYPNVKPFLSSEIMYYGGFIGMYYPFSMEANVTEYLSDTFYPNTVAHELAHLKGFVYEDEANFISYLACTDSDNPFVRYSGYLLVLSYVDEDYHQALRKAYGRRADDYYVSVYDSIDNFAADHNCYKRTEELTALQNKEQGAASEVFNTLEDSLMENAYEFYDNKVNYDEVTKLLLEYYDGVLY